MRYVFSDTTLQKERQMKARMLIITVVIFLLATDSGLAQMGGWSQMGGWNQPGVGTGWGSTGTVSNPATGYGYGYGMSGVGGMIPGMMGNTITYGYLTTLSPIETPQEARTTVQGFIDLAYSNLTISELWEYGTVYKAELSDTSGAKAFDLIVDKFTGTVSPEMGMSMMLNASYGNSLYRTSSFGTNLILTSQQAADLAQTFVNKNALGYTLEAPEVYPGYYKFHTRTNAGYGLDIMVNGYNGAIWMHTILGLPLNRS